jgi:hypothetical protein
VRISFTISSPIARFFALSSLKYYSGRSKAGGADRSRIGFFSLEEAATNYPPISKRRSKSKGKREGERRGMGASRECSWYG